VPPGKDFTVGFFGGEPLAAFERLRTAVAHAEAVARARGLIAGTHVALVVVDGSQPLSDADRELWASVDAPLKMLVVNKADLPAAFADEEATALARDAPVHRVSSRTGDGVPALRAALAAGVRAGRVAAPPSDLVWNARHREALRRARAALHRARTAVEDDLGAEFVAADLREAHDAVGAVTGQIVAEDILDVIFAEFCIGK
jgi:tRNA modification GTPase